MRAKEFITERSFSKRKSGPMATTFQFPSMPSSDGYQAYRFGLAMANHEIAPTSPTSQHAVISAYTPEEEEIIDDSQIKSKNIYVVFRENLKFEQDIGLFQKYSQITVEIVVF